MFRAARRTSTVCNKWLRLACTYVQQPMCRNSVTSAATFAASQDEASLMASLRLLAAVGCLKKQKVKRADIIQRSYSKGCPSSDVRRTEQQSN